MSDKDPKVVSDAMTKELETCNEWLIDNRLLLHLGKTEAMFCGTKRKIRNREGFGVKCKDTSVDTVTEVKYLGVQIDETLSGEGVLDTIFEKCTGRIKLLHRQAGCLLTVRKKDHVPIACSVSYRLCYIFMVCCHDSES